MLFEDNIGFVSYDLFNSMINSKVNNSKLVSVDEGFLRGNLFKDEYKPYKNYEYGKIIPKNQREALLLEIMELSFAINDINLYLDLHPNDEEMLRKFNSLVEKIIVNKDENNPKKIKLNIIFKTGTTLKASSNNLGKKYHLEEYLTTSNSSVSRCKWRNPLSTIYCKKYF